MGVTNSCRVLWALLSILSLCSAQSSVPVATQPIISAVTVTSVIPSVQTVYSVITTSSTEAAAVSIATITSVVSGQTTTVLATSTGDANARPVVIQTITNTLLSTISITTTQVIQSTIGFTTILEPGTTAPTTDAAPVVTATTSSITDTFISTITGASSLASTTEIPSATSYGTDLVFGGPSTSTTEPASATSGSVSLSPGDGSGGGGGLSTGTKAGIAVGVILGVTALVVGGFLLGQRYTRRRGNGPDLAESPPPMEKDAFRAGRPYELTGSNRLPTEMSVGKMHPYSMTTAETISPAESTSGRSYEMPGSSVSPYSEPAELSALPQFEDKDPSPMYVGVPAHMSGSKRWSMKEYEKKL